jgi:hypothetical protein
MPSCEIGCNNDSLLVTANCEAALRELRDPSETTKLWIDSICIDQGRDAIEERNTQVALMGQIYKCAKRVVVWLGKVDIRTRLAFDLVTEIANSAFHSKTEDRRECQRKIVEKTREISNSEFTHFQFVTNSFSHDTSEVKRESEDPMRAIFLRSWFHRMWTVQ